MNGITDSNLDRGRERVLEFDIHTSKEIFVDLLAIRLWNEPAYGQLSSSFSLIVIELSVYFDLHLAGLKVGCALRTEWLTIAGEQK